MNTGKRTIEQMDRDWDKWSSDARYGSRSSVLADCWAAGGFDNDYLKIHNAIYSMSDYIDYLRGVIRHTDILRAATHELINGAPQNVEC